MNWSNLEIDHVKSISLFDVSKNKALRETFNMKNTQPKIKQFNHQRGIKYKFLDYRLQFISHIILTK